LAQIFLFSLTAALNPTLLGAVTVMLVLPRPTRLLLGYLLGAILTSVTIGLVIVFALNGSSSATTTAKHTVNPAVDVALGLLILAIAFVVGTGRDKRRRARSERKRAAKADQAPPRWKQALSGGSARTTFVVGALLTLPGASYLAGLSLIAKQNASTSGTVLMVLGFNLVMLTLLELPLLGYAIRPEWTADTVDRFSAWLSRSGGRVALVGAAVIGIALIIRGAVELFS
jgi:Sap-like sulfolipid-1-addressing protein